MILAGVGVAILAIELAIHQITYIGSEPECGLFAANGGVFFENDTIIREPLEDLLACDIDLDRKYFKISKSQWDELDYTGLMVAAEHDLADVAETFLTRGADPNIANDWDETAMILASSLGHKDVVKVLVNHGADIEAEYHGAIIAAVEKGHKDILDILLENGADINVAFRSAVSHGHLDLVAHLLEKGVNIDAKDLEGNAAGNTPLILAVMNGRVEILDKLIKRGANLNLQNNVGKTALHFAIFQPSMYMSLLENGADVSIKDDRGNTVLLDLAPSCGGPGCDHKFKTLIEYGANINEEDEDGKTALMLANYPTTIAQLIDLGADVNHKDHDGNTALLNMVKHDRQWRDKQEMMTSLIDGGADPNVKDKEGVSPMLHAAREEEGGDYISILAEKGADINLRNGEGNVTALMSAAIYGRLDNVRILLNLKADMNAQAANGKTALHFAVGNFKGKAVDLLLDWGADGCIRDKWRRTPSGAAYDASYDGMAERIRRRTGC